MTQSKYTIVPMTAQHIPQIAALEQLCFTDPWSENSVGSELDNPLSLWLVALAGDTVAGYVGSQTVLDEADLMNVAVAPDDRKQGVARALLEELEARLRSKSVHSITLEVRDSNEAAIRLYEKLGYVQVGCRRGYYYKPREDARILRKEWTL